MTCHLLIGMIASGKSTFAQHRARAGDIIVNDDANITAYHGGIYGLYNKQLKGFYKTIEANMIMTALAMGLNITIDRTALGAATRMRYISIAKMYGARVVAVVFPKDTAEIHGTRRFQSDPRGFTLERWLKIAEFHESQWTVPTLAEGMDEIVYMTHGQLVGLKDQDISLGLSKIGLD